MTWRNDLEIIGHHAVAGVVWDGDQIDKVNRNKLVVEGYLYKYKGGNCACTIAGLRTWSRWRFVYRLWNFAKTIQSRIKPTTS